MRNIIEEQQASGLTITDYYQQNALPKKMFYAALNKLNALSGSFVREKVTKHVDLSELQQPMNLTISKVWEVQFKYFAKIIDIAKQFN